MHPGILVGVSFFMNSNILNRGSTTRMSMKQERTAGAEDMAAEVIRRPASKERQRKSEEDPTTRYFLPILG